jgi:hypothetical protein
MANATYFKNGTEAASRYLTACNYKGRTVFTYHSKRFNTRATHIQCCPREPREVHPATKADGFPLLTGLETRLLRLCERFIQ